MTEQDIAAVNARLSQAVADGDAAAAAACYTEDGKFMAPNAEPFAGRAAIQGFFQGALDGGVKALMLETLALEVLGDTAWEEGLYELHGEGDQVIDAGKFIVIWKRVNGQWFLHRDMISSNRPAA